MPQRDMKNNLQVVLAGALTLSGTTAAATDWVDTREFDAVTLAIITNTVTDAGAAAGFSFEVQHADDTAAASAEAVPDAQLVGLESSLTVTDDATDDQAVGTIGYVGDKRYVRVVGTGTTGTDAAVNVVAINGHGHRMPTLSGAGAGVAAT